MNVRSKLQLSSTSCSRLGNGQGGICFAIEQMISLSAPAAAVLRLTHKPALPWADAGGFSEQEAGAYLGKCYHKWHQLPLRAEGFGAHAVSP